MSRTHAILKGDSTNRKLDRITVLNDKELLVKKNNFLVVVYFI